MQKKTILFIYIFLLIFIKSIYSFENETKIKTDVFTRINSSGLILLSEGSYKHIYHKSSLPLFNGLYFQEGIGLNLTPANLMASVHFEWLPIAVLKLHFKYEYSAFFGTYRLSFDSLEDYGDNVKEDYSGTDDKGSSQMLLFQPTFQIKYGKLIYINRTDFEYYSFNGDGPFYLENRRDVLVDDQDLILINTNQILYEAINRKDGKMFLLGPFYEFVETRDTDLISRRAGGLFVYLPKEKMWGYEKPRLIIKTGVYLEDSNRENTAFLYVGAGVNFGLDKKKSESKK